jgi:hypothetical protein
MKVSISDSDTALSGVVGKGEIRLECGSPNVIGAQSLVFPRLSQKLQKTTKWSLTPLACPAYIRLTNDGGDAAGDEEVCL